MLKTVSAVTVRRKLSAPYVPIGYGFNRMSTFRQIETSFTAGRSTGAKPCWKGPPPNVRGLSLMNWSAYGRR